ncbi:MAG: membrane protein insertion efficiency factor YidD [Candidatus Pacebacteria bacterium]|nr:membrane protein insertion efficiency factor YidD [Candidatus Paceibacterota bacterium]
MYTIIRKIGVYIGVSLISLYQIALRPFVGTTCRYEPSCSVYGKQAIQRFGLAKGGVLTIKRIISCNPLSKKGVYDPVPEKKQQVVFLHPFLI